MNSVIVSGRLSDDIHFGVTKNGDHVCNFYVFCERKTENGETKTDKIRCTAWKQVQEVLRLVDAGELLTVVGSLHVNNYVDKKGASRKITEISAKHIYIGEYRGKKKHDE